MEGRVVELKIDTDDLSIVEHFWQCKHNNHGKSRDVGNTNLLLLKIANVGAMNLKWWIIT